MFKKRLIHMTCTALLLTVIPLALLLTAGTYLGWFSGSGLSSFENFYTPNDWERPKLELSWAEETSIDPAILEQVMEAMEAIDALPDIGDLMPDDWEAIEDARQLFDSIPQEYQGLVSNYEKLEEAESYLESLENPGIGDDSTEEPPDDTEVDTASGDIPGNETGDAPGNETGDTPGEETDDNPSDLPTGEVMFKLFSERGGTLYLKQMSYGDFNGQGWNAAEAYDKRIDGLYAADYLPWMTGLSDQTTYQLLIDPLEHALRLTPYYVAHGDGADLQQSDIRAEGDASSSYMMYFVPYSATQAEATNGTAVTFEKAYRAYVYDHYTEIDPLTKSYLDTIIREQGFYASDPDIINKVAAYIQKAATYNLLYDREMNNEDNVVIAFLRDYREGICVHYATAATMLYRALGIPARYTVGFLSNAKAGSWVEVTDDFGHAWSEVYVDGFGWQYVEVTGSSAGSGNGNGSGNDSSGDSGDSDSPSAPNLVVFAVTTERYRYDGTAHEHSHTLRCTGFESWLAAGYTYEYTIEGGAPRTQPGRETVQLTSLTIYDPDGNDVTADFTVKTQNGTLQVYIAELVLESDDITLTYNGLPQRGTADSYRINYEASAAKNGMTVEALKALIASHGITTLGVEGRFETKAGTWTANMDLVATDAAGKSLGDYLYVTKQTGELTIRRAPLVIVADSATAAFDPQTALEAPGWSFGDSTTTLGTDRVAYVDIEGTQFYPGESSNVVKDVRISNEQGEDVTGNYQITYVNGTLSVTMP